MLSNWESISSFVATWYWLPVLLIYIGIILTILSENRNPSKSLAYILVLVFLPLIGLIVYYLVGRQPVFKKIYFKPSIIELVAFFMRVMAYLPNTEVRLKWQSQN